MNQYLKLKKFASKKYEIFDDFEWITDDERRVGLTIMAHQTKLYTEYYNK